MNSKLLKLKIPLLFFSLFFNTLLFAQLPYDLIDGRENTLCKYCQDQINNKPREVLFGINIKENGDIYFSMDNKVWFDKIFKNKSYGITIDLVSEDRYSCKRKSLDEDILPKGTMTAPIYKDDMVKASEMLSANAIYIKVGKLPSKLKGKKVEGNLVILNGPYICYYSNFVNIDRSVWQLLPMGLFTDSLVNNNFTDDSKEFSKDFFTYSKKVEVTIPFEKSSSNFNGIYLNKLYDSISLSQYSLKKVDIRAYSSIEGAEIANKNLMQKRADTIVNALKKYEPNLKRINVITAENWLEFYTAIDTSIHSELNTFSKLEIKQKLWDKSLLAKIEPMLAKERKAIVTLYLENKSEETGIKNDSIINEFNSAISLKNIQKARGIQKEILDRIFDNKLPLEYLGKIEVPKTKDFISLQNDKEVYKYLLKATNEYEALDNFIALKKIDPLNGKINYNICALRFFMWKYGNDSTIKKNLLKEINELSRQSISKTLVKRMVINYQIMKSEDDMIKGNYAGKDSALKIIKEIYNEIKLNDEDVYSIAKYFSSYVQNEWALEIVTPRIDKLNVSEDLVFYYLNLLFYYPSEFGTVEFNKAMINAVNLNKKRFCNFFLPNDNGGASMQLLDYEEIKNKYCEACK
jgi:hypothetical protein